MFARKKKSTCTFSSHHSPLAFLIFFFLFGFCSFPITGKCWAATYYVDATNGHDHNDGLSQSSAWRTISKVNTSSFNPGDTINFKKGDIWREQLTVPSSGTSGHPITFGTYGAGNMPVISGANILSNWTDEGSSIYSATLTTEPKQVFYDDTRLTENDGAITSIGKNEWDWDANTLYINVDEDPSGERVEASQRDTAVAIGSSVSFITLNGLSFKHGNNIDLANVLSEGTYIKIQDCESSFGYGHGIAYATNARNNTLSGCNIHDNLKSGVLAYKVAGSLGNENYISENTVRKNSEMGIYIIANWFIVEKNLVSNNGNTSVLTSGIEIFNGDNDGYGEDNIVRWNVVTGQISGTDDGGGIYIDEETNRTYVYGNLCYNNDGPGFSVFDANYAYLYNNTSYDNCKNSSGELSTFTEYKFIATDDGDTIYLVAKNNIAQATKQNTYAVYVDPEVEGSTGLDIRNNDWYAAATNWYYWNSGGGNDLATWNGLSGIGSDLSSDPLFINAESNDFTIQAGSPCIDAGVNLGPRYDGALFYTSSWPDSVVIVDQDSFGDRWEIGAYVYVKATLSPPSNLRIINLTTR
jgi:parallel beta-helix repeat protein